MGHHRSPRQTSSDTPTDSSTQVALSRACVQSLYGTASSYASVVVESAKHCRSPLLILNSSGRVCCFYVVAQLSKVHRSSSVFYNRHKATSSDDVRQPHMAWPSKRRIKLSRAVAAMVWQSRVSCMIRWLLTVPSVRWTSLLRFRMMLRPLGRQGGWSMRRMFLMTDVSFTAVLSIFRFD